MKAKMLLCRMALIALAMWSTDSIYAVGQTTDKEAKKSTAAKAAKKEAKPTMEEMMAVWSKFGAPSEHHNHLAVLEGTWNATVKMWMDPTEPPTEMIGTSENRVIMGGRYLQQDYKGEFMGKPFVGHGLTGFDNYKQKYFSTWIDSESTMLFVSEGTCDGTGKAITSLGKYPDPVTNTTKKSKTILRIVDKNKHTYESFEQTPDGKWVKTMEIAYTRK
jgi:hypothetical protein